MTTATAKEMTAKETKWTWRGLVERLATKRTKAIGDYAELVERLAGGEEMADTQVEALLNKLGKSVYDLQADVATKAERLAWCAEIDRLQVVVADGEKAEAEDVAIIAAHNAAVAKLAAETDAKRLPLQARKQAGSSATVRISDLNHKLLSGCPDHLLEQQTAIMGELREAVAALTHQDNYLSEWRTRWQRQIDSADDTPEGRQQADAAEAALAEQQRQRDEKAARVADLQAQMDEIEAAKVKP